MWLRCSALPAALRFTASSYYHECSVRATWLRWSALPAARRTMEKPCRWPVHECRSTHRRPPSHENTSRPACFQTNDRVSRARDANQRATIRIVVAHFRRTPSRQPQGYLGRGEAMQSRHGSEMMSFELHEGNDNCIMCTTLGHHVDNQGLADGKKVIRCCVQAMTSTSVYQTFQVWIGRATSTDRSFLREGCAIPPTTNHVTCQPLL